MDVPTEDPSIEARFKPVLFEVVALLTAVYLPGVMYGVLSRYPRFASNDWSWGGMASRGIHDSGIILLVLFIIWNSGDGFEAFGIKKPDILKDVPLATAAFAITIVCGVVTQLILGHGTALLQRVGRPMGAVVLTPSVALGIASLAVVTLISSAYQELLMRGYLVTRLRELFGNTTSAILVSGLLFGLWHVYQGLDGVVSSLLMGLAFGWIFAKTGRLWPLVAGHALFNILVDLFM